MASAKRKAVEASHDGDEMAKKLKTGDDDLDSQTVQSKAAKFQGFDDDAIESLFNALFHEIKNFALNSFKGAPYSIPRTNQHKVLFQSLTSSDCKVYLKPKRKGVKPEIIKAAVWDQLIERLLGAPTKAFLTGLQEATIKTWASGELSFCIPRIDAKGDFYAWRSMTANFLSKCSEEYVKAWDKEGPRRRAFINDTAQLLLEHMVDKDEEGLKRALEDIADKAFELAQAMACCRAGWVCTRNDPRTHKSHGFNIEKDSMENVELWDQEEESSKVVDLVSVPMLLKRGNNRGEDYGTCLVIKKAQVVMKPKTGTH